jgi:hypothetical protein
MREKANQLKLDSWYLTTALMCSYRRFVFDDSDFYAPSFWNFRAARERDRQKREIAKQEASLVAFWKHELGSNWDKYVFVRSADGCGLPFAAVDQIKLASWPRLVALIENCHWLIDGDSNVAPIAVFLYSKSKRAQAVKERERLTAERKALHGTWEEAFGPEWRKHFHLSA